MFNLFNPAADVELIHAALFFPMNSVIAFVDSIYGAGTFALLPIADKMNIFFLTNIFGFFVAVGLLICIWFAWGVSGVIVEIIQATIEEYKVYAAKRKAKKAVL